MNFLKDAVLSLVGLIALNAVGYLAMNTSMGYDIIVYGCIVIVELLVLMWFVKWIRPRAWTAEEFADEYADNDYDYCDGNDDYDDEDCYCGDCVNDYNKYDASLKEACQQLDDVEAYLDRLMASSSRADESATNLDSETMKRSAREECEEDDPSHNDPMGESGEPGIVESDIVVENESDTTSLDDLINEVKSF